MHSLQAEALALRTPISITEKLIDRGSWRWIGQRVIDLSPLDVPIGGKSIRAIVDHLGGTAYRIGKISMLNAFVIDRPPLRLIYADPRYGGYRYAAQKVFAKASQPVDIDHVLARKIARNLGYRYVLLIRISPEVNRSHGSIERIDKKTILPLIRYILQIDGCLTNGLVANQNIFCPEVPITHIDLIKQTPSG